MNRHSAFVIGITVATVAFFAVVVLSPLALREFGTSTQANWSQLSNIGQTYGAVSALLTAMALVGVVASLLFRHETSESRGSRQYGRFITS
jgi:hypothetical protein